MYSNIDSLACSLPVPGEALPISGLTQLISRAKGLERGIKRQVNKFQAPITPISWPPRPLGQNLIQRFQEKAWFKVLICQNIVLDFYIGIEPNFENCRIR